jgi:hypothetical protein
MPVINQRWHQWSTMLQWTPTNHIKPLSAPAINQFLIVAESAVVCLHITIEDVKRKYKPRNPWSLHPSRHRDVLRLLQDSGLSFDFCDIDDLFNNTQEYDTNVMGRIPC